MLTRRFFEQTYKLGLVFNFKTVENDIIDFPVDFPKINKLEKRGDGGHLLGT